MGKVEKPIKAEIEKFIIFLLDQPELPLILLFLTKLIGELLKPNHETIPLKNGSCSLNLIRASKTFSSINLKSDTSLGIFVSEKILKT